MNMQRSASAKAEFPTGVKAANSNPDSSVNELNLQVLQRHDGNIAKVLERAAHVVIYVFREDSKQWERRGVEGPIFVVQRNVYPQYQMLVMNRLSTNNLVEDICQGFETEESGPYLLYRNKVGSIQGIWFYNANERQALGELLQRLVNELNADKQRSATGGLSSAPSTPAGKEGSLSLSQGSGTSLSNGALQASKPPTSPPVDSAVMHVVRSANKTIHSDAIFVGPSRPGTMDGPSSTQPPMPIPNFFQPQQASQLSSNGSIQPFASHPSAPPSSSMQSLPPHMQHPASLHSQQHHPYGPTPQQHVPLMPLSMSVPVPYTPPSSFPASGALSSNSPGMNLLSLLQQGSNSAADAGISTNHAMASSIPPLPSTPYVVPPLSTPVSFGGMPPFSYAQSAAPPAPSVPLLQHAHSSHSLSQPPPPMTAPPSVVPLSVSAPPTVPVQPKQPVLLPPSFFTNSSSSNLSTPQPPESIPDGQPSHKLSLDPAASYAASPRQSLSLSREKVREALQRLSQDDTFVDILCRELSAISQIK